MFITNCKSGQSIKIGNIRITILSKANCPIQIGIEAPQELLITREDNALLDPPTVETKNLGSNTTPPTADTAHLKIQELLNNEE